MPDTHEDLKKWVIQKSKQKDFLMNTDVAQDVKNIIGGEISEYTKLMSDSREHAIERMISDAKSIDADAVINVRFTTSMISQGTAEILAYGTAVRLK